MGGKISGFLALCILLLSAPSAVAGQTCGIIVDAVLSQDGTAHIRESWKVDFESGTEWYIDRSNLGDMTMSGLSVQDETGRTYILEEGWDIYRSLEEKDGKCGILLKPGGCEICLGPGSYGTHTFIVEYDMTNAVRAMDDYDVLHIRFINAGLRPLPSYAKVTVRLASGSIDDGNSAVWGFGYNGSTSFEYGAAVAETMEPFCSDDNSVILLLRFNKGIFSPAVTDKGPFSDVLERAFYGSTYQEYLDKEADERRTFIGFAIFFGVFIAVAALVKKRQTIRRNRKLFGVDHIKEIGWSRDLPFGGNLYETSYLLSRSGRPASGGNMASSLILEMIRDNILTVGNDASGNLLISFSGDAAPKDMPSHKRQFYDMLRSAAGDDAVLQYREFSRWAARNAETVSDWVKAVDGEGHRELCEDRYIEADGLSQEGKIQARNAIGFKKYLEDFTLINERKSVEVALWRDYLVFASLYGIARKVAKELRDIDPKAFEEVVGYDYPTMSNVLVFSDRMGAGMMSAVNSFAQTASSVGGHGGFSSIGGGGGFHGGGFGGGAR